MKQRETAGFSTWCAATIFLGAFLLFQVQPVISKMILPWFGGSPAVWTTCLLFFQVLLLAGYAYADLVHRLDRPPREAAIHLALVLLAVLALPITPGDSWKPTDPADPTWHILALLAVSVGLPYFLLSATSPLVQAWFARVYNDRSPYRLYALSNIGSLLALLSYPFLVEPSLTTRGQGRVWSGAFVAFAALCACLAVKLRRAGALGEGRTGAEEAGEHDRAIPSWSDRAAWVALPALASVLLLAVTNHLCQNVAVIPLLWIAPLSVYLLSFIICFDREAWYVRRWFGLGAAASVLAASYLTMAPLLKGYFERRGYGWQWTYISRHVLVQIAVYLSALFFLCMVCHGELVRRKPRTRRLTSFYLSVAAGGAAGGLLVALACPLVFSTFFELNLALIAGCLLALVTTAVDARRHWLSNTTLLLRSVATLAGAVVLGIVVWAELEARDTEPCVVRARNFYGILAVKERARDDPQRRGMALYHGDTLHGYQLLAQNQRATPTSYYTESSGVGITLRRFAPGAPLRVGAIGLGVGTIAAYARSGDCYRFYEINPLVIEFSESYFSFLSDARARGAEVQIVPGDARLALEREAAQHFDVIVLDAFSGDSIPVHLLTREAFDVYLRHLKANGIICVHVSNRYLNLRPVVVRIAAHYHLESVVVSATEENGAIAAPSEWILVTRNKRFLKEQAIRDAGELVVVDPAFPLWTDQYNNLFQILR